MNIKKSVHSRHADVRQHNVRCYRRQSVERLLCGARQVNLHALFFQRLGHRAPNGRVILDDEHALEERVRSAGGIGST